MNPTSCRVVHHDRSGEIWILRVEAGGLTAAIQALSARWSPPQVLTHGQKGEAVEHLTFLVSSTGDDVVTLAAA